MGKKGMPFYHIVIADGRAPRDGRFIEKLGSYNPLTRPADIQIDFDRALYWLQCGAQPTETVKAILSYKGVLYKHHLVKGVAKGALTMEQVESRFTEWLENKEARIRSKKNEFDLGLKTDQKKRLEQESKINQARNEALAKKYAKEAAAEAAAEVEAEAEAALPEESPAAEVSVAEEPVDEAPASEASAG